MNRKTLLVVMLLAAGTPILTQAQVTDTTTQPAQQSTNTNQGWKTYRGEYGPRSYHDSYDKPPTHYPFVGGALDLSFVAGEFLIGANPYFGYTITPWLDGGIAANFQYFSENAEAVAYNTGGTGSGAYHVTLGGAGVFARVYPIHFIFLHVQPEYNYIWETAINTGTPDYRSMYSVFSFLVGGGVRFGRPEARTWTYIELLYDVSGNPLSPYNFNGIALPIIRFGINVGLGK